MAIKLWHSGIQNGLQRRFNQLHNHPLYLQTWLFEQQSGCVTNTHTRCCNNETSLLWFMESWLQSRMPASLFRVSEFTSVQETEMQMPGKLREEVFVVTRTIAGGGSNQWNARCVNAMWKSSAWRSDLFICQANLALFCWLLCCSSKQRSVSGGRHFSRPCSPAAMTVVLIHKLIHSKVTWCYSFLVLRLWHRQTKSSVNKVVDWVMAMHLRQTHRKLKRLHKAHRLTHKIVVHVKLLSIIK